MAVADIKEFIDKRIKHYKSLKLPNYNSTAYAFFRSKISEELWLIKGRLDELDDYHKFDTADIKKYIDSKQEEMYYADKGDYFIPPNDVGEILEVILNMLDELEDRPKAKWIKTSLSYYDDDYGYECSNCKEIYCTDYDFEEMAYNYCPNCGAKTELENEQEN